VGACQTIWGLKWLGSSVKHSYTLLIQFIRYSNPFDFSVISLQITAPRWEHDMVQSRGWTKQIACGAMSSSKVGRNIKYERPWNNTKRSTSQWHICHLLLCIAFKVSSPPIRLCLTIVLSAWKIKMGQSGWGSIHVVSGPIPPSLA